MIDYYSDSIVPQMMLPQAYLLQADVVLKHSPDVNGHRLTAKRSVHRIVQVKFLQIIVA